MNVEHARIVVLCGKEKKLTFCDENGEFKDCEWGTGLLGEAIREKKLLSVFNCYTHPCFNP
jgi:hypothetical protein